jgi:hypothetical protein
MGKCAQAWRDQEAWTAKSIAGSIGASACHQTRLEIKPMRILAMLALALSLAACNGDRIKDGSLQPPSTPTWAEIFA